VTPRENGDWDDDDIIAALRGDDNAREEAIDAANAIYGRSVCGKIRRRLPMLSSHELFEIWDDTLMDLWQKARAGAAREMARCTCCSTKSRGVEPSTCCDAGPDGRMLGTNWRRFWKRLLIVCRTIPWHSRDCWKRSRRRSSD